MNKCVNDLIPLFDHAFCAYNTRLVKGGDEPEYIPADEIVAYHRIVFTQDYFSSALHEIAHWCVAGESRRLQHDYGYWYAADGRSAEQQAKFEQVEAKPQALEWLFSFACDIPFRVSADNLNAQLGASDTFKQAIVNQVHEYCKEGVNARAEQWITVLTRYYRTIAVSSVLDAKHYCLKHLSL